MLKLGVVLLGLDLVFPTSSLSASRRSLVVVAVVAITFFGTRWAGRRLGLSSNLSLLVATGFSICGVSAIAAANGVIDADEDEVAFSVALVTLCGTLAIVTLPPLRGPLGLDDEQFGAWVGASVHDVGAGRRDVVDRRRRRARDGDRRQADPGDAARAAHRRHRLRHTPCHRRPALPAAARAALHRAFVVAIGVASLGVLPDRALDRIDDLRTVLLGMALFALGTRVNIGRGSRRSARDRSCSASRRGC